MAIKLQNIFGKNATVGTRDPAAVCAANGSEFYGEEFFSKILHLEKRRSERSGKPFYLVLMEISSRCDSERKAGISARSRSSSQRRPATSTSRVGIGPVRSSD